jgi:hypothetical protein
MGDSRLRFLFLESYYGGSHQEFADGLCERSSHDIVLVTPQAGKAVSARAIWEAVMAGEGVPTKLVGPSGTFTVKPKT